MKKISLITVLISLLMGCSTTQYSTDAERQAAKLQQQRMEEFLFQQASQAINNQDFVLEAQTVTFKRGRTVHVSSNTNFISLKDGRATVQVAFTGPYAGPNGIGGITVEGLVSNIKTSTTKKGNVRFSMNVLGRGISAQVDLELIKGTNRATATVNPNFSSNRITLNGEIMSTENSGVFKGRVL